MISGAFDLWWSSRFGTNLPLAPVLREAFVERWVRFHVLPDAKLRPASDAEYRVLLRREDALADDVLSEGGPCWLVVPTFEWTAEAYREIPAAPGLRLQRSAGAVHEGADVTIWSARVAWRAGGFDPLLRAIADGDVSALWVSQSTGEVLAPCDGGVDVVAASPDRRAALASKFAPWLPRTPSSL
jgi:hypothetical protein